jgi:hypothetical protein
MHIYAGVNRYQRYLAHLLTAECMLVHSNICVILVPISQHTLSDKSVNVALRTMKSENKSRIKTILYCTYFTGCDPTAHAHSHDITSLKENYLTNTPEVLVNKFISRTICKTFSKEQW